MSNNLLKGKRGIIFGALDDQSIAWKVAERAVEEGAKITLTNAPVAMRFGKIQELGEKLNAEIIPADATSMEDLENLITKSVDILGGQLDFMLHSIGMSLNVRKNRHYTNLKHDWMLKTMDISAISFHKMMQVAMEKDAMQAIEFAIGKTYLKQFYHTKKAIGLSHLTVPGLLEKLREKYGKITSKALRKIRKPLSLTGTQPHQLRTFGTTRQIAKPLQKPLILSLKMTAGPR